MKTAAKVLGIAGGIAAIVMGFIFFLNPPRWEQPEEGPYNSEYYREYFYVSDFRIEFWLDPEDPVVEPFSSIMNTVLFAACAAGGALGITGGLLAGRKKTAAGVLMLIGSAFSAGTLIAPAILTLGGIFALIPENRPERLKEKAS